MKKCLWIVLLFMIFTPTKKPVLADESGYARISYSAPLYRHSTLIDSTDNIFFYTESSYFVKIILKYNDTCYKVSYMDIVGYMKADALMPILSTPVQAYPKGIQIKVDMKCYLRETPTQKGKVITTLSQNDTIDFVGKLPSVEIMDMSGDIWYYCKYNGDYGYVYSGYTSGLNNIIPNQEEVTFLSASNSTTSINPITDTSTIILIIVTFIPVGVILYLLYKPIKRKNSMK